MPSSGSVNITVGDRQLEDVAYLWGDARSAKRRGRTGWGVAIELPAVVDMVRLVEDGHVTASDVVTCMEAVAEEIRTGYGGPPEDEDGSDAWGADCPAASCTVCDAARERFDAIAAETLVQRKRLQEPAAYPYAAGSRTLHCYDCRETLRRIGTVPGPGTWGNSEENQTHNLRQFAHQGVLNSGWATTLAALSPAEAVQWIGNRTGPRGGPQYKICRICRPEIPEL